MSEHNWLPAITGGTKHWRCSRCASIIVNYGEPPPDSACRGMKSSPIKKSKGIKKKEGRYGPYYEYMKTVPCIVSGHLPVIPHHVRKSKGDEANLVPLTAELHSEIEQMGETRFRERYDYDVPMAAMATLLWEDYCGRENRG